MRRIIYSLSGGGVGFKLARRRRGNYSGLPKESMTHNLPLLDPRNDLVFKLLFARHLPLLTSLINAVRSHEAPVTVVGVLNPRIEPLDVTGKYIILDIQAQAADGTLFDVEMQIRRENDYVARSTYYLAKTMASQLQEGQAYDQIKPVVGIHLLGYNLMEQPDQACWCFEMRDRIRPEAVLGRELQLNLIELPKADRLASQGQAGGDLAAAAGISSALAAWVQYFEHFAEEGIMNQVTDEAVLQAMEQLKALSADAEVRQLAEARMRALSLERSEIGAAERRGEARGVLRGKQEALQSLIKSGMAEAQAKVILGL